MRKTHLVPALLAAGLLLAAGATAQDSAPHYRLAIGDPRYKDLTVEVFTGLIVSKETGGAIPFERMIRELKPAAFVLLGEHHESKAGHDLQARIIAALHVQDPRLAVALEMVPAERQAPLSLLCMGILTDEDFLRQTDWDKAWGFPFALYRPVFETALARKIPLYAVDSPRTVDIQLPIKEGGVLAEEALPAPAKPDPADAEPRRMLRSALKGLKAMAAYEGAGLDRIVDELFRAGEQRDEAIAGHVLRARGKEGGQIVVLVGAGHVSYGFGLERKLRARSPLAMKSVVPVLIPQGQASVAVSRSLADYVVGIAEDKHP